MLVLTRKKGEKIVILNKLDPTHPIEVVIGRINGINSVRLAVQAPKDIPIHTGSKKQHAAGTETQTGNAPEDPVETPRRLSADGSKPIRARSATKSNVSGSHT